jgi:hypothetical protein
MAVGTHRLQNLLDLAVRAKNGSASTAFKNLKAHINTLHRTTMTQQRQAVYERERFFETIKRLWKMAMGHLPERARAEHGQQTD